MKNNSNKSGLGLAAALVATAVGLYYLYGKDGKKNRKETKDWVMKAKGEVLDKLGKLDSITRVSYNKIVDDVIKQYQKYKDVDRTELSDIATELRRTWDEIKTVAKNTESETDTNIVEVEILEEKPKKKLFRRKPKNPA